MSWRMKTIQTTALLRSARKLIRSWRPEETWHYKLQWKIPSKRWFKKKYKELKDNNHKTIYICVCVCIYTHTHTHLYNNNIYVCMYDVRSIICLHYLDSNETLWEEARENYTKLLRAVLNKLWRQLSDLYPLRQTVPVVLGTAGEAKTSQ